MKILVLSNCPLLEHQGSGYIIVNTIRALEAIGNTVTSIPPEEFEFLSFLKNRATNYRKAIGIAKWMLSNKERIDKHDLIIFYGAESSLALFILKNWLRKKVKTVLHSNGLELHVDYRLYSFRSYLPWQKKWYNFDNKILFNYTYKNVDAIVTLSDYDKKFAVNHLKIAPEKVFALEPHLPNIYTERSDEKVQKQPIITFCGTWIARKGVDVIMKAIPDILRKYPHYKLRLIGVGYDFKAEEYFSTDVLPQIEVFHLVKSKNDLKRLYQESDIFLFPSFCESFGMVVAEAMSCGCAVITGPTGFADSLHNNVAAKELDL